MAHGYRNKCTKEGNSYTTQPATRAAISSAVRSRALGRNAVGASCAPLRVGRLLELELVRPLRRVREHVKRSGDLAVWQRALRTVRPRHAGHEVRHDARRKPWTLEHVRRMLRHIADQSLAFEPLVVTVVAHCKPVLCVMHTLHSST